MPNEVQNNAKQRMYHVHCHPKCSDDTLLGVFFGWMWDQPRMHGSNGNICELELLFGKNANAFLAPH